MSSDDEVWLPLGSVIVGRCWWAVPEKYAPSRVFDDLDEARDYADRTLGTDIHDAISILTPDGGVRHPAWSPEKTASATLIGATAVDERYLVDGDPDERAHKTWRDALADAWDRRARLVSQQVQFEDADRRTFWIVCAYQAVATSALER